MCYGSAKYGFCLLFKENINVVGGIVHVPCQSGLCSVHCDWEQWFFNTKNKASGVCAFAKLGHPFLFVSK